MSLQAVELGPPLERPVLNASAGSEVLNAGGGVRWTEEDTEGRGIVVGFEAIYDHHGVARWPQWTFLVHPVTHEVLLEFPRVQVTEDEVETFEQATDRLSEMVWELVLEQPVLAER